jgi:GNAT superfamily N-acetyltransferase
MSMGKIAMHAIDSDGTPGSFAGKLCQETHTAIVSAAEDYRRGGASEDWRIYLVTSDQIPVGICGFLGPPVERQVEILFHTFEAYRGRGLATRMTHFLVMRAAEIGTDVSVVAHTPVAEHASHRVLRKAGFVAEDRIDFPGKGDVQRWGCVRYGLDPNLSVAEFVDILRRSGLAERRPVDEATRLETMLRRADVIVTARNSRGLLVGVSRAISDSAYCTYLSDLAVDRDYQRSGIGRKLIVQTHWAAGETTNLILLAAPAAREYYPHIGMVRHDSCWMIPGQNKSNQIPVSAIDVVESKQSGDVQ